MGFMMRRADSFVILRRKTVEARIRHSRDAFESGIGTLGVTWQISFDFWYTESQNLLATRIRYTKLILPTKFMTLTRLLLI